MRWLSLTIISALGVLAFIDMLARMTPLLTSFPDRGELQFVDITLAKVNSAQVCRPYRGRETCHWVMRLEADDSRTWKLMLEPLHERQDHRYALLQPGDRLRVGQFQGRAYTLQRLHGKTNIPGLESTATLLSEAELYEWRHHRLVNLALWLMLDSLVIAAVLHVLWKRRRTSTATQQLLANILVLTVLGGAWWSWRPQPLPEERLLVDSPVRFFAAGELMDCSAGWGRGARCKPQRFILDDQARIWPLAYPASWTLNIARGAKLDLGVYDGRVYRVSYSKASADENKKCGYRQNPSARRTDVIWLCDDAIAIDPSRGILAYLQAGLEQHRPEMKFPPLPYEWTEQTYLDLRALHNRFVSFALLLLGAVLVLSLFWQGFRPRR